ncbi:hypothetical protein [Streptomyces sp. NPDC050504]|uniref:hypothetical protein n=1 Tax=Streptomyces sp. NPDC050504 TaxID=3365618 RepID=UPI0037B58D19
MRHRPDPANWLTDLPDETPIQRLSLPGTHRSASAAHQNWTIAEQLAHGVRFLDVDRVDDAVLSPCRTFLAAHPGELVLLRVRDRGPLSCDELPPSLGAARGRIVQLTDLEADRDRFGVQDSLSTGPLEKKALITAQFDEARFQRGAERLHVNVTALAGGHSELVMPYVRAWLQARAEDPGPCGAVVMDFPDLYPSVVPDVIARNFAPRGAGSPVLSRSAHV